MRFTIDDKAYEFDPKMTVQEAMVIKDRAGVGVSEFLVELSKGDPYCIAAVMFVLKKRAGEVVRWEDMLQLNILSFDIFYDEDEKTEEADADPKPEDAPAEVKKTSGKTPKSASTAT